MAASSSLQEQCCQSESVSVAPHMRAHARQAAQRAGRRSLPPKGELHQACSALVELALVIAALDLRHEPYFGAIKFGGPCDVM
jgi:hypothetical protein